MNLIRNYLTKNDCYKAGKPLNIKGIMVHSTGANNPNLSRYVQPDKDGIGVNTNGNDWNRPDVAVCVHAFIGKLEDGSIATVQTLPWNMRAWHAGSGRWGSANNSYISFEICEDDLTDTDYFKSVYTEAVELCAYLCRLYRLHPLKEDVILCHSEGFSVGIASNHADVMHWFPLHNKTMDDFRTDVQAILASPGGASPEEIMRDYRKTLQDNDAESWSQEARDWAIRNNLISGYEGNYMWQDLCNREQLVTILKAYNDKLSQPLP